MGTVEDDETSARMELLAEELEEFRIFVLGAVGIYEMAATDIQRFFRGFLARKLIRRLRKGFAHKASIIQRIGRGHLDRKWVISDNDSRQNGLVRVTKWARKKNIKKTALTTVAAMMIQQLGRMHQARTKTSERRDLYHTVKNAAIKLQTQFRMHLVRGHFHSQLVERRRQRHEAELAAYLKASVKMPRLDRMKRRTHENFVEGYICRLMIQEGKSYDESVHQSQQEIAPLTSMPKAPTTFAREQEHTDFCNNRFIATLGDSSSDSSDDSIEEEPIKLSLKPVKLIQRKKTIPNYITSSLLAFERQLDIEQKIEDEEFDRETHIAKTPGLRPSIQQLKKKKRSASRASDNDTASELSSTLASPKSKPKKKRPPLHDRLYYGFW